MISPNNGSVMWVVRAILLRNHCPAPSNDRRTSPKRKRPTRSVGSRIGWLTKTQYAASGAQRQAEKLSLSRRSPDRFKNWAPLLSLRAREQAIPDQNGAATTAAAERGMEFGKLRMKLTKRRVLSRHVQYRSYKESLPRCLRNFAVSFLSWSGSPIEIQSSTLPRKQHRSGRKTRLSSSCSTNRITGM